MRELRFISSVIIEIKSLCQFDAEIMSANVDVNIEIKVADEKTSACFFAAFTD